MDLICEVNYTSIYSGLVRNFPTYRSIFFLQGTIHSGICATHIDNLYSSSDYIS